MMWLFFLLACGPKPHTLAEIQAHTAAMEARVAALERENQELSERLAAVEAQQETWDTLLTFAKQAMDRSFEKAGLLTSGASGADNAAASSVPGCHLVEEGRYRFESPLGSVRMSGLSLEARATPHRGADGAIDGYRLSGIRRGKPLSSCGFRNGDILAAVGEQVLTTPDEALEAVRVLQSQPEVRVEVIRRLQRVHWVLEVPPDSP